MTILSLTSATKERIRSVSVAVVKWLKYPKIIKLIFRELLQLNFEEGINFCPKVPYHIIKPKVSLKRAQDNNFTNSFRYKFKKVTLTISYGTTKCQEGIRFSKTYQ